MQKIANSLHAVQSFAVANGIKFSLGSTPFEATQAYDNPTAHVEAALDLVDTLKQFDTFRAAGRTSISRDKAHPPIVVVYALDGFNNEAYATAMHEIGHVFTARVQPKYAPINKKAIGEDEVSAWDWAAAHAEVWTDDMQSLRDRALETYRQGGY